MTARADARAAGAAYLAYIAFTMTSVTLYGKATAGDSVAQQMAQLVHMMTTVRVTVLLDLMQMVCALVLAATLYQLTKAVDGTLSLLAMLFRTGEGLLGALPLLGKLELMRLAQSPGGAADSAGYGLLAGEMLKRPDDGFSAFCFVVGGFLFAYLFLRGGLIPRWLAWIGVATIGTQLVCIPLHMAGFISGRIVEALWMAIMFYEIPLGFWLVFKGVRETP